MGSAWKDTSYSSGSPRPKTQLPLFDAMCAVYIFSFHNGQHEPSSLNHERSQKHRSSPSQSLQFFKNEEKQAHFVEIDGLCRCVVLLNNLANFVRKACPFWKNGKRNIHWSIKNPVIGISRTWNSLAYRVLNACFEYYVGRTFRRTSRIPLQSQRVYLNI